MALDLNTNQNTISRYETGEREPVINELIKIADYFNVSVDYLLERTNNPNINRKSKTNFQPCFIFFRWELCGARKINAKHCISSLRKLF